VDFLQKHTQLVVSQPRLLQQVLLRKDRVLTSSTEQLSRPEHRGCWRCRPVHPRRAPPPTPLRLPPPLQRRPAQCSLVLLKPSPLQRRQLQAPCSPVEQGVGASATPRAPRQWGLDYDFQLAPPLYPTRLRHPLRRVPLAAPPAYKEDCSSPKGYSHDGVLDYSSQDNLPPEAWSLRP
jgi:hypothetical protein